MLKVLAAVALFYYLYLQRKKVGEKNKGKGDMHQKKQVSVVGVWKWRGGQI